MTLHNLFHGCAANEPLAAITSPKPGLPLIDLGSLAAPMSIKTYPESDDYFNKIIMNSTNEAITGKSGQLLDVGVLQKAISQRRIDVKPFLATAQDRQRETPYTKLQH